jgi:alpha-ketoglutarate-dependent taurine dioxygenase
MTVPAPEQGQLSPQLLPLFITPGEDNGNLVEWLKANRNGFDSDLARHGGLLFRGFNVPDVAAFNEFMKCFDTEPLPYMFRSSPREELDRSFKNIYLSTSYPNERTINMHNESSYSRVWGMKIVFCCIQPAASGGETPLADSRRVLKDIRPALVEKFRTRGVMYRRSLLPAVGMPWQEVFQTDDKNAAETVCRKYDIRLQFRNKDQAVIEWVKPAVYIHPVTREETWFNHVYFFNKFSRYEELDMDPGDHLPEEYLISDTLFGDGSEISYSEYSEIKNAYQRNRVVFPYQQGDIIFLDNMLAAHGRNPYAGDRVIATAIIEAVYDPGYMI